MKYRLKNRLYPLKDGEDFQAGDLRIEVMDEDTYKKIDWGLPHHRILKNHLDRILYCKAEAYGDCILGTFALPVKRNLTEAKYGIGYYLTLDHLIFVDNGDFVRHALGKMRGMNFANMPELTWKYGYLAIIVVSILTVIVEILIFKKKHII